MLVDQSSKASLKPSNLNPRNLSFKEKRIEYLCRMRRKWKWNENERIKFWDLNKNFKNIYPASFLKIHFRFTVDSLHFLPQVETFLLDSTSIENKFAYSKIQSGKYIFKSLMCLSWFKYSSSRSNIYLKNWICFSHPLVIIT